MRKICIILCMLILFTGCSSEKKNNDLFGSIDELIAAMHYDPIVADEMNKFVEFFIKEEIVSARENVDEDWEGDIAVIVTTKEGKEYGILSSATGYIYCITDRETGGLVYGATEVDENVDNSDETQTKEALLVSSLNIVPYSYDNEFELSRDMEATIEQIVLSYRQYQSDLASTEEWKNQFASMFLQNSRYGSGYFYSVCEENDDILTSEQVEYINYSITGEYVDFSDVIEGSIDCSECSSFWISAQIDDYQVTKQGDRIVIDAKIGIYNDGEVVPHIQLNSQIILVQNQYSFLDGYSINQITSEEIVIYSDGKEHTFVGCVALEEDDYFILEVGQTENDIPYGHFVKVYTEDNPEIAEYIRANESEYFTVTFIWENMIGPIEEVVPSKVEIADIFIDE